MCMCTPSVKAPYCGMGECKSPAQPVASCDYKPGDVVRHRSGAGPWLCVESVYADQVTVSWMDRKGRPGKHTFSAAVLMR